MRDIERYKPVFITAFTIIVMSVLASLVAWARETERYWILWGLSLILAFLIGKLWDYREPD